MYDVGERRALQRVGTTLNSVQYDANNIYVSTFKSLALEFRRHGQSREDTSNAKKVENVSPRRYQQRPNLEMIYGQ